MKSYAYREYGPSDVLRFEEVERPVPGESEVLVKVFAAAVNPLDWHFMRGDPWFIRLMTGLRRPKDPRIGVDVAGRVVEIGARVTRFKPGDEVFGNCRGAFAEYACAPENKFTVKPEKVSFAEAASAPVAGLTALQALRDKGKIMPGDKVLINGASGGVGTFAVQLARWFGAEVTAVCSGGNLELVRSAGAQSVIDYAREDFTASGRRYDLILDCYASHSLLSCNRALRERGRYVVVGGPAGSIVAMLGSWMMGAFLSIVTGRKYPGFLTRPNLADLTLVGELMAQGKVRPVIDRCYPLSQVPDAVAYLEQGHARGKVVITID